MSALPLLEQWFAKFGWETSIVNGAETITLTSSFPAHACPIINKRWLLPGVHVGRQHTCFFLDSSLPSSDHESSQSSKEDLLLLAHSQQHSVESKQCLERGMHQSCNHTAHGCEKDIPASDKDVPWLNDEEFLWKSSMCRKAFDDPCNLIKEDLIFLQSKPKRKDIAKVLHNIS